VKRGAASGSPVRADGGGVSGEIRERKWGPSVRRRRADSGKDGGRRLLKALGRVVEGKRGKRGGLGVGAAWRAGTGNKRGPGHGGGCLGWPSSAPDRRAWVVALLRDSGGWRGMGDAGAAANKWGRVTAGPGGQRLGARGRGSVAWC
jgi:hypothetical protein